MEDTFSLNYPNITGVNPVREILIHDKLKGKEWYLGIKIQEKKKSKLSNFVSLEESDLDFRLDILQEERHLNSSTFWLVQKDGGRTLLQYFKEEKLNHLQKIEIYLKVTKILKELQEMNIVHGDVHPGNILIDKKGKVSLIDFGWCYHKSFDMNHEERFYYENMLRDNFDLYHFRESLIYEKLENEIPNILL